MRYYGVDRTADRFVVQAMRSEPPFLAATDSVRQKVFGAALEQFDQLLVATEAVGPATAPIALFYSISQATRALAASRVEGDDWQPRGHGISVGMPDPDVGNASLTPSRRTGSFQLFCRSVGSPTTTEPVQLSSAWAAVGRYRSVEGLGAGNPAPIPVTPVGGDPGRLHALLEGDVARDLPADGPQRLDELNRRLARYPDARHGIGVAEPRPVGRSPSVEVFWLDETPRFRRIEDVAVPRLTDDAWGYVLVPALNSQDETTHPLAAMYAAWLGMSSIARYHPDRWQAALDRDQAPTAVAIEEAIEITLELLPAIVKALLTRELY